MNDSRTPLVAYNEGMRNIIILVLGLALVGAAFLSRPSEASFREQVKNHLESNSSGFADKLLVDAKADFYMKTVRYEDHYLWATIHKDGKTIHYGAFGRWFGSPSKWMEQAGTYVRG